MMDQLVSPMNNGAAVEARDNYKPRSDSSAADKSGFGDTLSSVKAKDQHAQGDEPDADVTEESAGKAHEEKDAAQVNERLPRQRHLGAQNKAAIALNSDARAPKVGKEASKLDKLTETDPKGQPVKLNADDVAELLQEFVGTEDAISVDELIAQMPQVEGAVDGDASIADMMSQFLVSAEAASVTGSSVDKNAKLDVRGADRTADKVKAKSAEDVVSRRNEPAVAGGTDGVDMGSSEATYRFSSVRGEGLRSLDMSVRNQDGKIDFEVKDAGGRITENVTVIESRRFLGLATPTNATALASLIAGDSEWMTALRPESALLNAAQQSSTGKVVHSLKLLLTPQDLGSVTVSLRMVGEELKVHMQVENQNAFRRLQEDNRSMLEALKAHGITVDQISISVSAAEKSDQSSSQFNGQQGNSAQINNDSENGRGANARKQEAEHEQLGSRDGQQNSDIDHDANSDDGGVYL